MFGLFNLMTYRDQSRAPREIYGDMRDQVLLAEQMGFDIAWFAEHHFTNFCISPSPTNVATYMAGQTSRIRLGTGVNVAPLYHPLRLIEDLILLDNLSDGRAVIGLGSGYQQYEFEKFGVELKNARQIFTETVDFVENVIQTGCAFGDGKFVKVPKTEFLVKFVQKRPDIYIAGFTGDEEVQTKASKLGYVPFVVTGWNDVATLKAAHDRTEAVHRAAVGSDRPMPYAIQKYVFVTDSREEALLAADAARYVRRISMSMKGKYAQISNGYLKELPAEGEPPLEELVERMCIGSPERCAEKLVTDIKTLGATHVNCFMALPGIDPRIIRRSMERFGAEVMPLVAKALGTEVSRNLAA